MSSELYRDAIQPVARQVGETLETVGRLVNVASLPLKAAVWWRERFEMSLCAKLKDVPSDRRIPPNPAVFGPALQALPYVVHQEELREMFANLVVASMDAATAHLEHPSFVEVLRQLTPDEARIVQFLSRHDMVPLVTVRHHHNEKMKCSDYLQSHELQGKPPDERISVTVDKIILRRFMPIIHHVPESAAD